MESSPITTRLTRLATDLDPRLGYVAIEDGVYYLRRPSRDWIRLGTTAEEARTRLERLAR